MYYGKSNFGIAPRSFSGLMEDILNNNWGKVFHDDNREYVSVPVNVKESEKGYDLQIIAPGLKKEDFKINIDKNVLSISFEQKEETNDESSKWIRKEYMFRSFKRSFNLSDKINQAGITAGYTDGVLNVSLPKKETTETTTQEITVA